jgi:hypothetical protein
MKTFGFSSLLILISITGICQSAKNTYIIIRMPFTYYRPTDNLFCSIDIEPGNPYAKRIYDLITFKAGKNEVNEKANFFHLRNDTTTVYYNYFRNRTEALYYLSEQGWELITVGNDTKSTKQLESIGYPYTVIETYPVFYFKKAVN